MKKIYSLLAIMLCMIVSTSQSFAATPNVNGLPDISDVVPDNSTIEVDIATVTAGDNNVTITITLKDATSAAVTDDYASGVEVFAGTTSLGNPAVADLSEGKYTLTASLKTAETVTLSFKVDGTESANKQNVTVNAGAPSADNSTIGLSANTFVAGTAGTLVITATLKDAYDNTITGATITYDDDGAGTISDEQESGAGVYTAKLTPTTTAGLYDNISFTVGGVSPTTSATLTVTPAAADLDHSTITASPASIVADGTSTSTITVQLYDQYDNVLTTNGGKTVTILINGAAKGSLSGTTTDKTDGTFEETLTAPNAPGSDELTFKFNAGNSTAKATVTYTQKQVPPPPPPPDPVLHEVSINLDFEVPDLEECVTTYPAGGTFNVEDGEIMTLLVFLSDACDDSDIKLVINGDTIIPEEKKNELRAIAYTFRFPVSAATAISVIGVEKNDPVGIPNLPQDEPKVWTSPGYIHVSQSAERVTRNGVRIYTITGKLAASLIPDIQFSTANFQLPKGIYLVVIDDLVVKVIVSE